jgi:hypothetical protein
MRPRAARENYFPRNPISGCSRPPAPEARYFLSLVIPSMFITYFS